MRISVLILLLAITCAPPSMAAANRFSPQLLDRLARLLPPGAYLGHDLKARPCNVYVKRDEAEGTYLVQVTRNTDQSQKSFLFSRRESRRPQNMIEKWPWLESAGTLGNRVNVVAITPRLPGYEDVFQGALEQVFFLEIDLISKKMKVSTGNMYEFGISFGLVSCIIPVPHD